MLLEHYPASESFPDGGEHLDQVAIDGCDPDWRRVWPLPPGNPRHAEASAWMAAHGHAIISTPA